MSARLTSDQRAILDFLALSDGEGCVLAHDIASELGLSRRGMGGRMLGLWTKGFVQRIVVKPAPSPWSDTTYGWTLTDAGRREVAP